MAIICGAPGDALSWSTLSGAKCDSEMAKLRCCVFQSTKLSTILDE